MSQQQDSQGSSGQSEDDEELYTSSSPWLVQGKDRDRKAPKSEHPSTYDESIPPLSYHAQDAGQAPSSSPGTKKSTAQQSQKNRQSSNAGSASDADAFETTYRPYSQYTGGWQVPPWARPQQNNAGTLLRFVLLIIGIVLFPMLCVAIRVITLLHVGALILLLIPILVVGALLLAVMVITILSVVGKIGRFKPPFWW